MTKMIQIEADRLQQILGVLERAVSFDASYETTVASIREALADHSAHQLHDDPSYEGDSLNDKFKRLEEAHMRLRRTVRFAVAVDGERLKNSIAELSTVMNDTTEFNLPAPVAGTKLMLM